MNPYIFPGFEPDIQRLFKSEMTFEKIVETVCSYFHRNGLLNGYYAKFGKADPKELLLGRNRTREVVEMRMFASYFMHRLLPLTHKSRGALLGGRDHSSVIHHLESMKDFLQTDKNIQKIHKDLTTLLCR